MKYIYLAIILYTFYMCACIFFLYLLRIIYIYIYYIHTLWPTAPLGIAEATTRNNMYIISHINPTDFVINDNILY